jgi:protein-S-isoprenylcysteine O-methyltransferase Ste14
MGATKIEFRLRVFLMVAVVSLGFWSPWIETWGGQNSFAQRIPLLEWLALQLSRLGLISFTVASSLVIVAGALIAAAGAILRVWGTACLGTSIVNNTGIKAGVLVADGPYRYIRNPLYLGSWCMFAAMALIMPVSGALFAMVLLSVLHVRLILAEEAFLAVQLGEPYQTYLRTVPRLIPRLKTGLVSAGSKPHWLHAVLAEINPIGVFIILAVFSWSYNNLLMIKAIIVSFGVSLVARALTMGGGEGAGAVD